MKKLVSVLLVLATLACLFAACSPASTMKRGERTDSAYTNETLGLTFNLPSGWRFYTDEEIAQTMNMTAEMFKNEDLLESSKVASVMDFMAIHATTGNNVNLSIENLRVSGNANISMEKYVEASQQQIKDQLQGATYTFKPTTSAKLGNVEFTLMEADCTYSGVNMTQYMYLRKEGSHMVVISCTSVSGIDRAVFEQMFA